MRPGATAATAIRLSPAIPSRLGAPMDHGADERNHRLRFTGDQEIQARAHGFV